MGIRSILRGLGLGRGQAAGRTRQCPRGQARVVVEALGKACAAALDGPPDPCGLGAAIVEALEHRPLMTGTFNAYISGSVFPGASMLSWTLAE